MGAMTTSEGLGRVAAALYVVERLGIASLDQVTTLTLYPHSGRVAILMDDPTLFLGSLPEARWQESVSHPGIWHGNAARDGVDFSCIEVRSVPQEATGGSR